MQMYELRVDPGNGLPELQLVNANGTIHRIGGYGIHHAIWNKAKGICENWDRSEDPQCPWCAFDILSAGHLVYVKSKNVILFAGNEVDNCISVFLKDIKYKHH